MECLVVVVDIRGDQVTIRINMDLLIFSVE